MIDLSIFCEEFRHKVPPGEWQREIHYLQFQHASFDCYIRRIPGTWAWCGYVAIDEDHPYYHLEINSRSLSNIEIHGGVTHAGKSGVYGELSWYIGFDTCHPCDIIPLVYIPSKVGYYKNQNWVTNETKRLAEILEGALIYQ